MPRRFTDENGRRYLVWKEDGNSRKLPTPLRAQPLSFDGTKLIGKPHEILRNEAPWEAHLVEGPFIIRRGEWLYMFYSADACCGRRCNYKLGVARRAETARPVGATSQEPDPRGERRLEMPRPRQHRHRPSRPDVSPLSRLSSDRLRVRRPPGTPGRGDVGPERLARDQRRTWPFAKRAVAPWQACCAIGSGHRRRVRAGENRSRVAVAVGSTRAADRGSVSRWMAEPSDGHVRFGISPGSRRAARVEQQLHRDRDGRDRVPRAGHPGRRRRLREPR